MATIYNFNNNFDMQKDLTILTDWLKGIMEELTKKGFKRSEAMEIIIALIPKR